LRARCARWRALQIRCRVSRPIDIVGTGGDASGSLNLSTGAALLTAAAGVPVVKHGNRSVPRARQCRRARGAGLRLPLDERGGRAASRPVVHLPVRAALSIRR
jgi:hypothetical protein